MTTQSKIDAIFAPLGIEVGFSATHLPSGATVCINPHALFSTASVFKVPLMVEVFRQAEAGKFRMSDRLPMPEARRTMGSGVLQKLEAGIAPTIRDLTMLMIIISDNTATEMLLHLVGPANVTATMRSLGLENIHVVLTLPELFAHAYGLPPDPVPSYAEMLEAARQRPMDYDSLTFAASPDNTTTSAADMSRLMALIFQGKAGSAAACADMMTIMRAQQLRDRVPRYLPTSGAANKTGTFRGIRNDAGLIMRGGEDAISFALFTFDRTELPVGNSRPLAERNILVNGAMAEVGQVLWDSFGR
jgi:beta-lactamase class A